MADEGILQSMFPPAPLIEEDAKFDVSNFLEHNVQLPRPKAEQLLQRMKTFYENRLFCDLTFVCGNVDMGYNSVPCHSLVMVSALPELYNLCEIASNLQTENDISRIFLWQQPRESWTRPCRRPQNGARAAITPLAE